jgi:hypothetical protein
VHCLTLKRYVEPRIVRIGSHKEVQIDSSSSAKAPALASAARSLRNVNFEVTANSTCSGRKHQPSYMNSKVEQLIKADIVVCTLSGSGSQSLLEVRTVYITY